MLGVEAVLPDGTVLDLLHTLRKDNTGCAQGMALRCALRLSLQGGAAERSMCLQRKSPRLRLVNEASSCNQGLGHANKCTVVDCWLTGILGHERPRSHSALH